MQQLTPEVLAMAAAWFVVFLFSTTLHEAAHAAAALKLGDATAHGGGQVTLNPIPHIRREPIGMVVVPLLSFFLERLDVRLGERALRSALGAPLSEALGADGDRGAGGEPAAGAGGGRGAADRARARRVHAASSCVSLVEAAGGGALDGLATVLSILFSLNLILFAFNLLPLPPMDGSAVIQLFMSDDAARWLQSFYRQPMIGWVGLLIAWQLFGRLFRPIFRFAVGLLFPDLL